MFKKNLLIILIFNFKLLVETTFTSKDDPIFSSLAKKINTYQVLKPVNFSPPLNWAEKQGLFRSDIRVNFVGSPIASEFRSGKPTAVFDNDMFSTGWIITALLESQLYGKGTVLFDENRLQLALEAIGEYNNKNDDNSAKSLVRTFWPQVFNATTNLWFQQPINIRNVAQSLQYFLEKTPWSVIEKILKFLKLNNIEKTVEKFLNEFGSLAAAAYYFSIPPDFDDTYLNLGIGALLSKLDTNIYPIAFKSWQENNTNIEHLLEITNKYSYKPFDSDLNKNLIDPRTYFYARNFLRDALKEEKSVSLITTWIQNIDEQRQFESESISMPFNLNNVDVTVASNAVFGITSASIYNINNFGDMFLRSADLQQTYLNSTKFIGYMIETNLTNRPDLAQLYYPSRYNFMWYASRTLFLIENEFKRYTYLSNSKKVNEAKDFLNRFENLKDILFEAKSYLKSAFEITATKFLFDSFRNDDIDSVYFCDFLGQNDTNILNEPISNNDDCLFSTAQAINIIIATWTFQNPDKKSLEFKNSTPNNVVILLKKSVNWLKKNVLGNKYKPMNAFFSGSLKSESSNGFYFPTNFLKFLNGSDVDVKKLSSSDFFTIVNGVKGYIDEETYEKLIQEEHFGQKTPTEFNGYNNKDFGFPFWSSEPYTYAISLLALSQYNNLSL